MTLRNDEGGWKRTNPKGAPNKKELNLFLKLQIMIDFMKETRTLASIRREAVLLGIIKNFPGGIENAPNDVLSDAFTKVVRYSEIGEKLFDKIELHTDGKKYIFKLKNDITKAIFVTAVETYITNHPDIEGDLMDYVD